MVKTNCGESKRLRDFSANGRALPWFEVKAANLSLAAAYAALGKPYGGIASRMKHCGSQLEFQRYEVADRENDLLALFRTPLCRSRLCYSCQIRLARLQHYHLADVFTRYFELNPRHRLLLLTLTDRNAPEDALGPAIDRMLAGHRRLMRYRRVSAAVSDWYRSLEITRNAETGEIHHHTHKLVCVPAEYFDRKSDLYIDQAKHEWTALWRRALQTNYDPVVDIRAVRGGRRGQADVLRKSLREVTKYVTKPSLLRTLSGNTLLNIHVALKGRRLTAMSRGLRTIARAAEAERSTAYKQKSAADFLPDHAVYLGRELYRWHADEGDYVLAGTIKHRGGTDDVEP